MQICGSFHIIPIQSLFEKIVERIEFVADKLGETNLIMPIGLLFVVNHENGGNEVSDELVRRFKILDKTSDNLIDFYYIGWKEQDNELVFDIDSFVEIRRKLKRFGIESFGGYADLIIADAELDAKSGVSVNFDHCITVDLSNAIKSGTITSLGKFLDAVVRIAGDFRKRISAKPNVRGAYYISDRLGIFSVKESLIQFILNRFGNFIGANKIATVSVRNLGSNLKISDHLSYRYTPKISRAKEG